MRYTLLMHYSEAAGQSLSPEMLEEGQRAFASYSRALEQAAVLVSAEVLQDASNTTTLTTVDGRLRVQDGPFADTKEQLGGTIVIDVPDLDAAIEWARQAPPISWGSVEIRPGAVYTVAGEWTPNA